MSLATRCTACNTVFRVVQDQLKVSEGWVRCGRCNEVFNALEGLFDLTPAPTSAFDPSPAEAPSGEAAPPPADFAVAETPAAGPPIDGWPTEGPPLASDPAPQSGPDLVFELPPAPAADAAGHASTLAQHDETPASRVAARDRLDFADAQFNSALLAEDGIDVPDEPVLLPDVPPDGPPSAGPAAPGFLRQAESEARWGRPRNVVALSLLGVVLALALALQAVLHFRDTLAAVAPALQPALEALCGVAQCRIDPLRRIDDIVIESSALTAAPGGDAVRLSVVLRNRGSLPLAMPSIEMTLADPAGKLLVRRALSPADFAVARDTLAPGAESALQLVMSTGGRTASGYTVEPFYP